MTTQNNNLEQIASFIEEATGESHLRIEHDLGDGFVRLKSSEAEKRQAAQDIRCTEDIVIELLRNCRDAGATEIYVVMQREENNRVLTVIDNGQGIPASMHERIFEPRVTSKLDTAHMDKWGMHGRGMALYSTKVNSEKAYIVASEPGLGSSIQIETNLNTLTEKADQSTFPTFEVQDSGAYAMRGPKNILRIAAEFALEHRTDCQVWCGTVSEILATMYSNGAAKLDKAQRVFNHDLSTTPYVLRPSFAFEAEDLANAGKELGLDISSRTAHRILKGEISPLPSLLTRLKEESMRTVGKRAPHTGRQHSAQLMKLTDAEMTALKEEVSKLFEPLAESNYLLSNVEPTIRIDRGCLKISIPIVSLEE